MGICMSWCMCGGWRTICRNWFGSLHHVDPSAWFQIQIQLNQAPALSAPWAISWTPLGVFTLTLHLATLLLLLICIRIFFSHLLLIIYIDNYKQGQSYFFYPNMYCFMFSSCPSALVSNSSIFFKGRDEEDGLTFFLNSDNFRFTNVMYKVNYEIFYRYLIKLT